MSMRKFMVLHLPTNILITNLALSDLGVGILVMPFTASSLVQLRQSNVLYDMDALCSIVGVFRQMLLCSSTYTMAAISFERFIGVQRPMSYKRIVNKNFAIYAVIVVWIYSVIYSLITVFMPDKHGDYVYNDYTGYCIQEWWFLEGSNGGETLEVIVNTVFNFLIPFSLMGYYYSKVLKALHANLHFCHMMRVPSSFQSKYVRTKRDREINSAWTVLIILVAFVVCWIPFLVQFLLIIIHNFDMGDKLQLYFVTFANMFYFLGCGINPMVYIFRCSRFKKESTRLVLLMLNRLLCCNSRIKDAILARVQRTEKMTPRDYARASMKYYSEMRGKRKLSECVAAQIKRGRQLAREDSEYNTSAFVSYKVEDYSADQLESEDLGGYGRCEMTAVVIHNRESSEDTLKVNKRQTRSKKKALVAPETLPRWLEHSVEDDDQASHHSGISLDVDRSASGYGDGSSTSSKQVTPQKHMMKRLSRKLHCITSTLTTQETVTSMGSSNVFSMNRGKHQETPTTSGSNLRCHSVAVTSEAHQNVHHLSQERSTPSLWYENMTSPLKASKKLFRDMMAEVQDKSLSFHFSTKTNKGPRSSDADDLRLQDHGYSFPRTSSSATMKSKLEQKISSDFESDDAFLPSNSEPKRDQSIEIRQTSWQRSKRAPSLTISAQRLLCKSCSTGDLTLDRVGVNTANAEHKIMFNNFIAEDS